MRLFLPRPAFITQLDNYQEGCLRSDIYAGLAIAAVGLPSTIAYPAIAGLPPESGFYASITPLIAYALFGPSRQLIVGPDVATMTMLAAVLPQCLPRQAVSFGSGARAMLERAGVIDKIGRTMIFEGMEDALLAFEPWCCRLGPDFRDNCSESNQE